MAEAAGAKIVDAALLRTLAADTDELVVTIAFPTRRAAVQAEENATRLKSARKQAGAELAAQGVGAEDAAALLAPLQSLLGDHELWLHQLDGVVIVLTQGQARVLRLPYPVPERVVVGKAALLSPLLPSLTDARPFAVLAVSRDHIRLLLATRTTVEELDLGDVPTSVADLPGEPATEEPAALQLRSVGSGDAAIFHGHERPDFDRLRVEALFRRVDAGVAPLLDRRLPVVLAGVGENTALYRSVSRLTGIVEGTVTGDPAPRRSAQLRDAAWPVVVTALRAPAEAALGALGARQGTGMAVEDLVEVVTAARAGRVATLLVGLDDPARGPAIRWGPPTVDDPAQVTAGPPQPGEVDLVDAALRATLLHGGEAYSVPAGDLSGVAAALLRY